MRLTFWPLFLFSVFFLGLSNPSTVENSTALASNSGDDNFFLASFDQLQKDRRIQCEKIGNYEVLSTLYTVKPLLSGHLRDLP